MKALLATFGATVYKKQNIKRLHLHEVLKQAKLFSSCAGQTVAGTCELGTRGVMVTVYILVGVGICSGQN